MRDLTPCFLVCEAVLGLTLAQEIDEVFYLGQALRWKLLDLVEQDLIWGVHDINPSGFRFFTVAGDIQRVAVRE